VSRLVIDFPDPLCTIVRHSVQLNFRNGFTCTPRSLGASPGTLAHPDNFDLHLPKSAESQNIRPAVPESVALIGNVYRLQKLMDSKLCVTAGQSDVHNMHAHGNPPIYYYKDHIKYVHLSAFLYRRHRSLWDLFLNCVR